MRTSILSFHFLLFEIQTHSENLRSWIHEFYFSLRQPSLESLTKRYHVQIEEIGSPWEIKIDALENGFPVGCVISQAQCYFRDGIFFSQGSGADAHVLEFNVLTRTLRANVGGELVRYGERFIYGFMRQLLKWMLFPLQNIVMMHAAVVTKNDKTVLLSGRSGMGKSTTSLQLARRGYRMLSDDSPLVILLDGAAVALSSLDGISLTTEALQMFPNLQPFVRGKRERSGKHFIDHRPLRREGLVAYGPATITHVVQLHRTDDQPLRIFAGNKFDILASLVKETLVIFGKETRLADITNMPEHAYLLKQATSSMFEIISQLISDTQVFVLEFSAEHSDRLPDVIDSILDGTHHN